MAIFNNHVQQAAGSDNITFEQLEDSRILAGLYKLQVDESFSIYRDNKNRNIFYIGNHVGAQLYKSYTRCAVIVNGDVYYDYDDVSFFNSMTEILIPYNDGDSEIDEYFIRFNNDSGVWSALTVFKAGESVKKLIGESGFNLVDNTDPLNPIVLSDRTKADKNVSNFSFTGGYNYKPGDVIETSESPEVNGYVVSVNPDTGEIEKLILTGEPLTESEGKDAVVSVDAGLEGSFAVFGKDGNIKESDVRLKADWLKPYDFTFKSVYDCELSFDTKYDESDLAGNTSDYGFGFTANPLNNFDYILINKETEERLTGHVDFDYNRAPYTPNSSRGSLVWYGIVDGESKVQAISDGLEGYANGDTFEFRVLGTTYTGEIVNINKTPWEITTTLPNDAGAGVTGFVETTTTKGKGKGLMLYIKPTVPFPGGSASKTSIPSGSFVWSGVKVSSNNSMTKLGTVQVPFQFTFDLTLNEKIVHCVEYNTVTVNGYYGIHSKWLASNLNTVEIDSKDAQGWNAGDSFTVTVGGNDYDGQIISVDAQPYTFTCNLPQTTDKDMTGSYEVKAKSPASGTGLKINITTSLSDRYRLENIYVDPHGGYDPSFYSSSMVDMLLARQRVQAGIVNDIIAFSGVEGRFEELIRREKILANKKDRSHLAIPTELAVTDYIEGILDSESIANLTDEWVTDGLKHSLNRASGEMASSVIIPYATDSKDGLLRKETYNKISKIESEVLSLQNLDFIAAELGETPEQADITAAWKAAGKSDPVVSNRVINISEGANQGHSWMYLTKGDTSAWYDIGSSTVPVATNSAQGIVVGTEPSTTYKYYPYIVRQEGSAEAFVGQTLTTQATGAENFTVRVDDISNNGVITKFTLSPQEGAERKMLANIPFSKTSTGTAYDVTYVFNLSNASGYVAGERFTCSNDKYTFGGIVINTSTDPITVVVDIPLHYASDISGTYQAVSENGSGTGIEVIITCTQQVEVCTLRLDITSWDEMCESVRIKDLQGHMTVDGVGALREQVEYLYTNKADKQEIDLTSDDGSITIKKLEGNENRPQFDLSFNLATSSVWITLTPLLDGKTQQFDITSYLQGVSVSDLEFYYGDGILIPGVDYSLQTSCIIEQKGTGYKEDEVILLNNDTRHAKITGVDGDGGVISALLTTAPLTTSEGNGAEIAAQYIYNHLKSPAMNSADNRTFMAKGVKLSLVSDLSGLTEIKDASGTLNISVLGSIVSIGLNVDHVFKATKGDPCYVNFGELTPTSGVLTEGSIYQILQNLSNNVDYIMKNAVWKYSTDANRIEIAVQDEAIEPKEKVDIISIRPEDLGQIAPELPIQ